MFGNHINYANIKYLFVLCIAIFLLSPIITSPVFTQDENTQNSSGWFSLIDMSNREKQDTLTAWLEFISPIYDSQILEELSSSIINEINTYNAEWEREARELNDRVNNAEMNSIQCDAAVFEINQRIRLNESVLNQLKYEIKNLEESQRIQNKLKEIYLGRIKLALTNVRNYYIIYVESLVPPEHMDSVLLKIKSQIWTDWLKPAMEEEAITKGNDSFLGIYRELLNEKMLELLAITKKAYVVDLPEQMPFSSPADNLIGAIFPVFVKPPPTFEMHVTHLEPDDIQLPEWINPIPYIIYDSSLDTLHSAEIPWQHEDVLKRIGIEQIEKQVIYLRSMQNKSIVNPAYGSLDSIALDSLVRNIEQVDSILKTIAEDLKTMRESESALKLTIHKLKNKDLLDAQDLSRQSYQDFILRYDEWIEHIKTRHIKFFPLLISDNYPVGSTQTPEEIMCELLLTRYAELANSCKESYISSMSGYVIVDSIRLSFNERISTTNIALIDSAEIVYKYLEHQSSRIVVNVGLAVDMVFNLPEEFIYYTNVTPRDFKRALAIIDTILQTVEYNELIYKALPSDQLNIGRSYDRYMQIIDFYNKDSTAVYKRNNWRLPTIEELEQIRHVSITDEEGESYTIFPELEISPDKKYWTCDPAGRDAEPFFWTVKFGRVKIKIYRNANAACHAIMVAEVQ